MLWDKNNYIGKLKTAIVEKSWLLPLLFFFFAFFSLLPAILIADLPQTDVLTRYAPMADAVSRGDWAFAFHPRIPPLLPFCGGVFAKVFHCNGYTGVKLASLLFFAMSFLALIPLFRRIFDLRTTILAGFLAVFGSQMMRLVVAGLRESGKMLFFSIAAYSLIRLWQECRTKRTVVPFLLMGISCSGMIYVRDDSVLPAFLFLLAAVCIEIFRGRVFPWRTFVLSCIPAVILMVPLLGLNYKLTGYPVPSNRFISVVKKIGIPERIFDRTEKSGEMLEKPEGLESFSANIIHSGEGPASQPSQIDVQNSQRIKEVYSKYFKHEPEQPWDVFWSTVESVLYGFYFIYFLPALLVAGYRIYRRLWRAEETILFLIPLLHFVLIFVQVLVADKIVFVSSRYLLALSAFYCCWTAVFVLQIYDFSARYLSAKLLNGCSVLAVIVFLCVMYLDGMSLEVRERTSQDRREKRAVLYHWIELIRNDWKGPDRESCVFFDANTYHSFRRPVVYSDDFEELGYFTGGETNRYPYMGNGDKREIYERISDVLTIGIFADYFAVFVPDDWNDIPKGYRILDEQRVCGDRCVLLKRLLSPGEKKGYVE